MKETYDELTVRTLNLVDHEGRLRIRMNGGDEKHGAYLLFYTAAGYPGLQIHDQPDGRIVMSFVDKGKGGRLRETTLSEGGLGVDDGNGMPAIHVGRLEGTDHYALTVYKDGEELFELPLWVDPGDPGDDGRPAGSSEVSGAEAGSEAPPSHREDGDD